MLHIDLDSHHDGHCSAGMLHIDFYFHHDSRIDLDLDPDPNSLPEGVPDQPT